MQALVLFKSNLSAFELNQNNKIREQSADEGEDESPADGEETARHDRIVLVHLQAEIVASLRRFRILRSLRVNLAFDFFSLRLDPTSDRHHPRTEPEVISPVKGRHDVEDELRDRLDRRRHEVVKSEEIENAEDDELAEVVEQVQREAEVQQVHGVAQSDVNVRDLLHQRVIQIPSSQGAVDELKSFVNRVGDEHVADEVAQVSGDVYCAEQRPERVHVADLQELRRQLVVDVEREK